MESIAFKERKRDRFRKFVGKDVGKPHDQSTSDVAIALRPKVSSDDTHRHAAVDTTAVMSEPPKVANDDLWAEAYERCKLREKDLVAHYEQHMKAYTASAGTAGDDHFSPAKIAGLIKTQRGDLDAQRFTLSLRDKSITIRDQGEKIVEFVLWFNSTISSALASQPYASLAWSGVSILLPLLLNPSKQSQKMMDGLQTISDLMRKCQVREELFPKERMCPQGETPDAYTELRNASVELYSYIFEYEAQSVCHLSRRSAQRALSGVLESNDWTGILEKIDNADKICASLIALLDKSKEHTLQERQTQEFIHQTKMFENFQRKFLDTQQHNLEAKLMSSLASDYESGKDSIAPRVDGTCEWFFRDERFHRWRDNESSSLLWISAGPGCGKSVLARTLVDECLLSSALHTTTCYFFFKEGVEQRTKAANALSAILHQLFHQNPQLISNALSSFKSFGGNLSNTFSELWKVLIRTAEDENAGHVICVLDALDECETTSTKMVIDKIIDYYGDRSQQSSSAVLKFLITSRPYSRVRSPFDHLRGVNEHVHLDGEEHSTDISNEINLVIDDKVQLMTRDFAAKDRTRISNRLKEMEHRTYLWLYLTLNIIEREQGKYGKASQIETLLNHLPVDVSAAYERILDQSSDIECARTLLQIITAASKPLTLAEANVALTVATQDKKPQNLDGLDLWPKKRFKSTVQDICGLFVSVHRRKLSLIHQTARQFLLQTVTEDLSDVSNGGKKWRRCFTLQCAHEVLCSICVDYLTLDDFTKLAASSEQRKQYANASSGAVVFFKYAARKWALHYQETHQQKGGRFQTRAIALCKPDHNSASYWLPTYSRNELGILDDPVTSDWSAVGIASVLNLADVVQYLLTGLREVDQRAGYFQTAIKAAILLNKLEVLPLLCQFNTSTSFGHDPRSNIVTFQSSGEEFPPNTEPLSRELEKLDISKELSYAIKTNSSPESILCLLSYGANPNAQDEEGKTLLFTASLSASRYKMSSFYSRGCSMEVESVERVRLLLKHGADPNMQSKAKITPLQVASGRPGIPAVVRLLLQANADVNVTSAAGESPIFLAKRELKKPNLWAKEAAEIVQLLRDAGAKEDIEEVFDEEDISDEKMMSLIREMFSRFQDVFARGGYGNGVNLEKLIEIVQLLCDAGAKEDIEEVFHKEDISDEKIISLTRKIFFRFRYVLAREEIEKDSNLGKLIEIVQFLRDAGTKEDLEEVSDEKIISLITKIFSCFRDVSARKEIEKRPQS